MLGNLLTPPATSAVAGLAPTGGTATQPGLAQPAAGFSDLLLAAAGAEGAEMSPASPSSSAADPSLPEAAPTAADGEPMAADAAQLLIGMLGLVPTPVQPVPAQATAQPLEAGADALAAADTTPAATDKSADLAPMPVDFLPTLGLAPPSLTAASMARPRPAPSTTDLAPPAIDGSTDALRAQRVATGRVTSPAAASAEHRTLDPAIEPTSPDRIAPSGAASREPAATSVSEWPSIAMPTAAATGHTSPAVLAGPPRAASGATLHEAVVQPRVGSDAFAPALGLQISTLASDGVQHARLHLNPAELGPITVKIALDGSGARVDFQVDAAFTRAAIEASLPALAGAMHEAGLTLTGGGVFQQPQERPTQGDARHDRRPAPTAAGSAEPDGGPTLGPLRALRRGLVDLVA